METSFREFAEVFFQLSDCFLFSTFVGLLPVRVFPFFLFLYVPTEPASRAGGVWTKLLHPFHSFLVSSFCLPALSPIFHSKNFPHDASVFSSLLAADLCRLPNHSPVFVCITALYIILLSLSPRPDITVLFNFLWPFFFFSLTQLLFDVLLFCSV